MNRSVIYDYLKHEIDELKILFYKHGRGYVVKFVPEVWTKFTQVIINEWYIENFYSITLMIQGIAIRSETDEMEVFIRYKDINKFEVQIEEID